MSFFFEMIAAALAWFYSVVPSYGFAIIALTLVVMIVLTPLTLKGTRSMMMMQQLQPEMKKLQSKYKDDRQKLNEELLKFYKENNINPVGGCLPLLIQMPVFLVLYNVLRGLTQRVPSLGSNIGWVSGQTGIGTNPLTKPPTVLNNFVPQYLPQDSKMYQNLSQTNTMPFAEFGFLNLSESCSDAIRQGVVHALPYIVLIVIVGVSGFVQQRQIQGRTPNSQIPQQQQQIMKIMPIFLPVISFGLPSGLVVYFAVSNLYRIGQQWFISRSIYGIKRGEKPDNLTGTKASNGGAKTASGAKKALPAKGDGAKGDAAKTAPKTNGSKTTATKAPATKSTSKANGTAANGNGTGNGTGNGNGKGAGSSRGTAAGAGSKSTKNMSTSTPDAKNESRSAKASGDKTPPADPKAAPPTRDAPTTAPPTLQPRARKNKKR